MSMIDDALVAEPFIDQADQETGSTVEWWTVEGIMLSTLAYNVASLAGQSWTTSKRGENPIVGRRHGRRWIPKKYDQRTLTLAMWVKGSLTDGQVIECEREQYNENVEILKTIFGRNKLLNLSRRFAVPTSVNPLGYITRYATAEVLQQIAPSPAGHGAAVFTVDLVMPDPWWYGEKTFAQAIVHTKASGLKFEPAAEARVNFEVFPFANFGPIGGAYGEIDVWNEGNAPLLGVLYVLRGPLTDPRLEHVSSGKMLEFDIGIGSTSWLEIDTLNRTIMLNGTTSRYNTLLPGSEWWDHEPGHHVVRLRAAAGTGTVEATWRSAWF